MSKRLFGEALYREMMKGCIDRTMREIEAAKANCPENVGELEHELSKLRDELRSL